MSDERPLYVYRLHVTRPEGSDAPGWEPDAWDPAYSGDLPYDSFHWPRNKPYFSKTGAEARADLFRQYGATVTIERSLPVQWDGQP